MRENKLQQAIRDLRYLLDRGYPRSSAVSFVANHFRLSQTERYLLTRCVFSRSESKAHRAKLVRWREIRGKTLGVDGYNVLITLESLIEDHLVIRCDDGVLRDLRGVFGKFRFSAEKLPLLRHLVQMLKRAEPRRVAVFFDRQVSKSGELAATVRKMLAEEGLSGEARAVKRADSHLRGQDVVASSDRIVIERARQVWDLPADFARLHGIEVLDLRKITRGP